MSSVLTQHYNTRRTGANLEEAILDITNVRPDTFGLVHRYKVPGQVYAQPLFVEQAVVPNQDKKNLLYVCTMHNTVHAFNADPPFDTVWETSTPLRPSIALPDPEIGDGAYKDIHKEVGILSTPVASLAHNALFLVLTTKEKGVYGHFLFSLDLGTGAVNAGFPVKIEGEVTIGTTKVSFDSRRQLQRSGLLELDKEVIYFAFASYGDREPYNGWIFGYGVDGTRQAMLNTTPLGKEAGIWQAGQGLAKSDADNIFAITGNGSFEAPRNPRVFPAPQSGWQLGDCFLKMDRNLNLRGWFSPFNNQELDAGDTDLGSAGPVLLPFNPGGGAGGDVLIGGGKEGRIYVLEPNSNLGLFNPQSNSNALQDFQATSIPRSRGDYPQDPSAGYTYHIHGSPVFWQNNKEALVYVWGENDWLRAYGYGGGRFRLSHDYLFADPKRTLDEISEHAVVPVDFKGTQFALAWTGTGKGYVNVIISANGRDFDDKVTLKKDGLRSDHEPGFAAGSGRAVIAWTGTDTHLNFIETIDLIHYFNKRTYDGGSSPEERSDHGPSLTFGSGRFFVAYTGTDGQINVMTSLNGVDYADKVVLPDQFTDEGPRIAFAGGLVYVLWKGMDNQLNVLEMTSAAKPSPTGRHVVIGEHSDFAPSLAGDPASGKVYLAWTGREKVLVTNVDRRLNTMAWNSANDLMTGVAGRKQVQVERSNAGPCLAMFGGQLFIAWNGTDTQLNAAMLFHPEARTSDVKAAEGMPGAILSISAFGSDLHSGILWASRPLTGNAVHATVPGILHAFNAADITQELWNSEKNPGDGGYDFAKFCPPTVADGHVYLATFSNEVRVYGLR